MNRIKIGKGYWQSGHGKGFCNMPNIYLIDGKAFAKHQKGYECLFDDANIPKGYVPVNFDHIYKKFHQAGLFEGHLCYEVKR